MSKFSYILFYKPYNVLCQFTDDSPNASQRETLKHYIDIPNIYSVGRLDLDSEGLLLLTDNPRVKHRLCEPSFAHPRTYWCQVENIRSMKPTQIYSLSSKWMFTSCFIESLTDLLLSWFDSPQALLPDKLSVVGYNSKLILAFKSRSIFSPQFSHS